MKVLALLDDGNTIEIPNVHWHPEFVNKTLDIRMPAGCYVRKSYLQKKVEIHNKHCDDISMPELKWTLEKLIEGISCAEMPFSILDDESETPWKNFGNCVKEVHYGMSDDFWQNHA